MPLCEFRNFGARYNSARVVVNILSKHKVKTLMGRITGKYRLAVESIWRYDPGDDVMTE